MIVKITASEKVLRHHFEEHYDIIEKIRPGQILKVMIHETTKMGTGWYLIDVGKHYFHVHNSEEDVVAGRVIRHYTNFMLEPGYSNGNYAWIKSEFCEPYEEKSYFKSNKNAKLLLQESE